MINKLLKKYIPSEYYLKYLEDNDITFSDFETAAILSNIIKNPFELNEALKSLSENSNDNNLVKQIHNKIDNDDKLYKLFKENANNEAVYIVKRIEDNEEDIYGYFFDYQNAYDKALELNNEFIIEKQKVQSKNNVIKGISYVYINPYYFDDAKIEEHVENDYTDELGYIRYDVDGSIRYFYVKDLMIKDKSDKEILLKAYNPDYFENAYIYLPNPFAYGDIVKDVTTEEKGIVECRRDDYEAFNEKVKNGFYADNFDAGTTVCYLKNDGRFIHNHPLVLFLEKYEPDKSDDNYEILKCASAITKQECSLDYFTEIYEKYRNNHKGERK